MTMGVSVMMTRQMKQRKRWMTETTRGRTRNKKK